MKKVVLIAAIVVGNIAAAQEVISSSVNVTGEGIVYAIPDEVVINFAIENQGDYVMKVKEQTEIAVDKVLDFLKKQAIPAKNIQTEYVHLNKQYDYPTKTYHYSSRQAISVKIQQIKNYEKILTGLMEAGVNRIENVSFQTSNLEVLKSQARKEAILNAKKIAEEYATTLGQHIGSAISISDLSVNPQPIYRTMAFKEMAMDSSGGERNTIAPGQLTITEQVNVHFRLNQ